MFLRIFDAYPETNPRFGMPIFPPPHVEVPTDPRTIRADSDPIVDRDITHPLAWDTAQLSNFKYRMLLEGFLHYLFLDRCAGNCKLYLADLLAQIMGSIALLSNELTLLPRQKPNIFVNGRAAQSASPFEMPWSALSIGPDAKSRWRNVLDAMDSCLQLEAQIIGAAGAPADLVATITGIKSSDDFRRTELLPLASGAAADCP